MRNGLGALVVSLLAAGSTVLMALGCSGDETTGPGDQTGNVQVSAATIGTDLDVDGYAVSVDGGAARDIAHNGSTTFSGVSAGVHQVELTGVADNCSVTSANPVSASVTSGHTAQVAFEIRCDAPPGFIQVSTTTAGADLDSDGYTVKMDGTADRSIGLNGVTTFSDVAVGSHQVELTGIADNCSVSGSNPATAPVASGETAQVSFDVDCEALPIGSLTVTTTVTNNFDPDGYEVFVTAVSRGRVNVEGTVLFEDLPAGTQEVELREIAPNCEVDGDNPATVDIPVGGAGSHTFSVTCTSPPDGRIVHMGAVSGVYGLVVKNADGSGPLLVWECPTTCRRPRWSPDGSRIAFSMWADPPSTLDIYTVARDGSDLRQLTDMGEFADSPAWSPDGTRIAFNYHDNTCCDIPGQLYFVNADGTGLAEIPRDGAMYYEDNPDWSPDGTKIVFAAQDQGYLNPGIFVMSADGGAATRLTAPPPICDATGDNAWKDGLGRNRPRWSPDGTEIVFGRSNFCEPAGVDFSDLLLMNADGSGLGYLADGPASEAFPSWSPDGSRVVFDDGSDNVYVINADGTEQTVIGGGGEPDWGP